MEFTNITPLIERLVLYKRNPRLIMWEKPLGIIQNTKIMIVESL
jgi:hypothetical protein